MLQPLPDGGAVGEVLVLPDVSDLVEPAKLDSPVAKQDGVCGAEVELRVIAAALARRLVSPSLCSAP